MTLLTCSGALLLRSVTLGDTCLVNSPHAFRALMTITFTTAIPYSAFMVAFFTGGSFLVLCVVECDGRFFGANFFDFNVFGEQGHLECQ